MTTRWPVRCTGTWSWGYTSRPEQGIITSETVIITMIIIIIPYLVPSPGHAVGVVPAELGAVQLRVRILIGARREVLAVADHNIRLYDAAL